MHRSRRWLAAPALALTVTLAAAACGGSSGGGGGDQAGPDDTMALPDCPVDALDSATGPVDVTLWFQLAGKAEQTMQDMVAAYNASQDKVRVNAELQGASYDELLRKYESAIPSRDLPNVIVAEDTATQFLMDSDTILPAQACFDADGISTDQFVRPRCATTPGDGALYPGTASLSDILTYYNKNHFTRAGLDPANPPTTLDEVRAAAEAIKAAGVTETPVVLLLDSWFLETQLTGSGQTVVNNDNGFGDGQTTEATFDTPETQAIFDWVKSMVDDGLLTPVQVTPGNVDHYLAMATQKASLTIETSTASTSVTAFLGGDTSVTEGVGSDGSVDTSGLDLAAAPVFGVDEAGQVQVGGNGFFITSTSSPEKQAAAWDFMKWWNEPAQQVTWNIQGSYLPFLTAAVDTPEIQDFWANDLAGSWLKIAWDELQSIDPNFTGPRIGPYDKTRLALRNALAAVAFQGTDPTTAITTAKDEVDQAITEYNDTNF